MNNRQQELIKAIEFVRQTFADRRVNLDYTLESIRHLDRLFDEEFKNGKLKNPDGGFAKFQGLIMIGISGYLAEVILKNATRAKLVIQEEDKNWFINFQLLADDNRAIQPGQQILQRIRYGTAAALYGYVVQAIKYFTDPAGKMPGPITGEQASPGKSWWKFWQ